MNCCLNVVRTLTVLRMRTVLASLQRHGKQDASPDDAELGRADSHVDSHDGATPSHVVESMDGCHARYGRERTLSVPMNGLHGDF